MKILTPFLVILLLSFAVFGQVKGSDERCYLTVRESPILRGIKLRMSADDIGKILETKIRTVIVDTEVHLKKVNDEYVEIPYGAVDYDKNTHKIAIGETFFSLPETVNFKPVGINLPKLEGVESIFLRFYKDSLFYISIKYETIDYKWKDAKEFLEFSEEKMGLPKGLWSGQNSLANGKLTFLSCSGFTAHVSILADSAIITIADSSTQRLIEDESKRLVIQKLKISEIENLEKKQIFKPKR